MTDCPWCKRPMPEDNPRETPGSVIRRVFHSVVEFHGVSKEMIQSTRKFPGLVAARQDLWFQFVIVEGWTLNQAGAQTSGQWNHTHHTTVLSGIRAHARRTLDLKHKSSLAEIRAAYQAVMAQHEEQAA